MNGDKYTIEAVPRMIDASLQKYSSANYNLLENQDPRMENYDAPPSPPINPTAAGYSMGGGRRTRRRSTRRRARRYSRRR